MVRIMRRGKMHQRFFSDRNNGGKRKALAAAREHYAMLEETLPPIQSQKGRETSRNSSGVVGVHLAHDVDSRYPDCEYWSYVASWLDENGKRVNVRFAWNRYGDQLAWELACIARQKEIRDREEVRRLYDRRENARVRKKKKSVVQARKTSSKSTPATKARRKK